MLQNRNPSTHPPQRTSVVHMKLIRTKSTPSDPYTYLIPGTSLSLLFHTYGPPLSPYDAITCLDAAKKDVVSHAYSDRPLGLNKRLVYKSKNLYLQLLPLEDEMTWNGWGLAVAGILDFQRAYLGFRGLDFDVVMIGMADPIGIGKLVVI